MSNNDQHNTRRAAVLPIMLLLSVSLHWVALMWLEPARIGAAGVPPPLVVRLLDPPVAPDVVVAPPPQAEVAAPLHQPRALAPVPLPEAPAPESDGAEPASPALVATAPAAAVAPASAPLKLPAIFDPTWYEARQLDVRPHAVQTIQPDYPPQARRDGVEGSVRLMLKVDESGAVREVRLMEAEPAGVFDAAALAAFGAARFAPARRNGLPVRALIYVRVSFRLD